MTDYEYIVQQVKRAHYSGWDDEELRKCVDMLPGLTREQQLSIYRSKWVAHEKALKDAIFNLLFKERIGERDREDRDKRDEEGRDNSLSSKCIENNEAAKRDKDGVEETEDRARVVRTPYRQLPSVQKDIIQFCAIPRTAKEIMDHIGYYNNSKYMTTYVRPLLEMGYLEMTEPDKPQSKNQKYRKVRKD